MVSVRAPAERQNLHRSLEWLEVVRGALEMETHARNVALDLDLPVKGCMLRIDYNRGDYCVRHEPSAAQNSARNGERRA
jgi:hypothetical protein